MKRVVSDTRKYGVGKTVLIVDDNAIIRKMLAAAFLSDGFKTCGEVDNGKNGIELAKTLKPDLVTLDLSMPIMNGLHAASELRRLFPNMPMILFALYGYEGVAEEAAKVGINLVLSKQVSLPTLIEKAHKLMSN
jgi:two-component system chemotaxis response regulator CheY